MRLQSILLAGAAALALTTATYISLENRTQNARINWGYSRTVDSADKFRSYVDGVKKSRQLPDGVKDIVFITNHEYQRTFGRLPGADAAMETVNVKNPDNHLGSGGDSIIYVLEQAFKSPKILKEEDFLGVLYDHEAKHAKDFKDGVLLHNGRRITIDDFVVGTNGEGRPLYQGNALQSLVELSAYSDQLNKSKQRDVSVEYKSRTREQFLQFFALFVITGKVLNAEVYREVVQEYVQPWMVSDKILGVMPNEQGEEQACMLVNNEVSWLPKGIVLPKPQ